MLMLIFLIYFFFLYPSTLLFLCDNMLLFLLSLLPFGLARLQLSFLVTYWIQLSLLSIIFCLSFHLTYLHILNILLITYLNYSLILKFLLLCFQNHIPVFSP